MVSATSKKASVAVSSFLLFLIFFGLWQAYDLLLILFSIPSSFIYILYVTISALAIVAFSLFVKLRKTSFKDHGFRKPLNTTQTTILAIFSIFIYLAITIGPGFVFGFAQPPLTLTPSFIVFSVSNAILASLAGEAVFRGYVFRNLTENHGFFTSLYVSSILFSLHQLSINTDILGVGQEELITFIFTDIIPLFAAGLFLGFMFYKTNWSLLGPIIFRIGALFYDFLPPIVATPPWWMHLTFELVAYIALILILDAAIKEPKYRRKRYGLET